MCSSFTLEPGPQVGKALRGLDAQIDSEQFRSTPRTCQTFRGRLRVLKIERIGPCRLLVHLGLTQSERRRTDVRHEAVRVHPAPWRRGGLPAARGARAETCR